MAATGRFVVPEVVVSHFHLKDGDKVADFGAGSGFFLKALSERVGQTGRVYACEIQKQLVEKLGDFTRLAGIQNVDPIWCDLEEPGGIRIPDAALDVGVLVNTFFQIEQKEASIKEMRRTIRQGGLMYVIDWTESWGGMGPQPGQVVSEESAKALFESNGFIFERAYPAGDHHYGLAFRKLS